MVTCTQQRLIMLPLVPLNPFAVGHKITVPAGNVTAKTNTITNTTTQTTNTKPKLAFSIDALVGGNGGAGGGGGVRETNSLMTPNHKDHIIENIRTSSASPLRPANDNLPCIEPLELRNSFREIKKSLSPTPALNSQNQHSPVIQKQQESGQLTPNRDHVTSPLRSPQTQSPALPNEPQPGTSSRSTTPLNSPRDIDPITPEEQRIYKLQPQLPPGLVRPFPLPPPGSMPLIRPMHTPGDTALQHPSNHNPSTSLLPPPPNAAPTSNPHLLAAQFQMAAVLAHHQQQQQQQQQHNPPGPHNPNLPPQHPQGPPHLPPHLMHTHHLGIFPPGPHHPPFGNPHLIRDTYPLYPWLLSRHGRIFSHRFPGFLLQPFRKPKRVRTAFSPTQLLKLEHAFEENHYVVGAERKQLAQNLSLTETQVKVWFQNRRTKHKRMQQEGDSDSKSQKGSQSGDNEGKNDSSQTSFEDQDDLEMAEGEEVDEEEDEVIDMDDYDDHEMDAEERKRMTEHFQEMQNRHFAHSQMFQQQSQQHQQFLQQHFLQQQQQQQQQLYAQQNEHQRQQQQQLQQQQPPPPQQQPPTQKH